MSDLPHLAAFVPGADVVEALESGLRPEEINTQQEGSVEGLSKQSGKDIPPAT